MRVFFHLFVLGMLFVVASFAQDVNSIFSKLETSAKSISNTACGSEVVLFVQDAKQIYEQEGPTTKFFGYIDDCAIVAGNTTASQAFLRELNIAKETFASSLQSASANAGVTVRNHGVGMSVALLTIAALMV